MDSRRLPSLLASAALHLGLFLAAYISLPFWSKPMQLTETVPVTIVAQAPTADVRPAEQAPKAQTAASPRPEAAPEPPSPPIPAPRPVVKPSPPQPAPPQPKPAPPTPKPKPAPPPPKPKPAPTPAKPEVATTPPDAKAKPQPLNLDQLASQSKAKSARTSNASTPLDLSALAASPKSPHSSPIKGQARPETDLLARLAVGRATGLSGDAMGALQAKLYRLWHPNCEVEGGAEVQVRVEMKLSADGRLVSSNLVSQTGPGAGAGVVAASAQRALFAVEQGEPYTEIPRDAPHDIILRFDAKQACQQR